MATKQNNTGNMVRTAAVGAALAGAAAGAYYLYGSKDAKKHRRELGEWVEKARKDIGKGAGKVADAALNKRNYAALVKKVAERYQEAKGLTKKDAAALAHSLISEWEGGNKKGATSTRTAAKKRSPQPRASKSTK